MMVKNGSVIYVAHPEKTIDPSVHTHYVEDSIDLDNVPLNGGVLLKTMYLSSDPYMRYRMRDPSQPAFVPPIILNDPIDNFGVGQVVRSDDPKFKPGDYVYGYLEFSEYFVYPGKIHHEYKFPLTKIEKLPNVPLSVYVGTLGMPGTTAYQALKYFVTEKFKTAKTMFVSGGAGPVGTFVIEYSKAMAPHLKIIASAGSADKVKIMQDAGAEVAFNYKEQDTFKVLREHGPLDIYWDNVAGPTLDAALQNFRDGGLIIACGAISQASHDDSSVVRHFDEIFKRSLTVHGFVVATGESAAAAPHFFEDVVPLVRAGKIRSREHRYVGLREAGRALADVHTGANTGKAVIVVSEE
ncbi:NADP-dependent oxidoreductase [Phanerochaete sordida]|uniref:NADP-dependent oxidoreductase n=1 Tax=Phanerochaete sordida TaxID=48140 RepID=A0A9P3LGW2_9APHY|nr:NADP-dependent oxidoreductase [Phanerochaete sordida]